MALKITQPGLIKPYRLVLLRRKFNSCIRLQKNDGPPIASISNPSPAEWHSDLHNKFTLLIAVAICLLFISPLALSNPPCAYANALIEAELFELAKNELRTLNAKPKTHNCVNTSVQKLVAAQKLKSTEDARKEKENNIHKAKLELETNLNKVETLLSLDEYENALALLRDQLAASIDNPLVQQLIEKAKIGIEEAKTKKAAAAFIKASKLSVNGFDAESLEALKEAIKENPEYPVPPDLEHISGIGFPLWQDTKMKIKTYAAPITEMLAILILACLILYFLWRYLLAKPLLRFDDFNDSGLSSRIGPDVKALVKAAYQGFSRGHSRSATRVVGNLEGISLPGQIQQALPGVLNNPLIQALPLLFEKFLPRRVFTVKGFLHDSESQGTGLTIVVTSNRKQGDSITLWESEFQAGSKSTPGSTPGGTIDQSGDYSQLANYASVWLLYRLTAFSENIFPVRLLKQYRLRQLLGTDSWRAYSLFQSALAEDDKDNRDTARKLYVKSLREDTNLAIAKINLAWIARKDGNWDLAQELWTECKVEAKDWWFPFLPYQHELTHFAALYSLAALKYSNTGNQKNTDPETKDQNNKNADEAALIEARILVDAIERRHIQLSRLWGLNQILSLLFKWQGSGDLRHHLERLMHVAKAMLGGLLVATNNVEPGKPMILETERQKIALPRIQYNLACSFSILAKHEDQPKDKEEFLRKSIDCLKMSYWLEKATEDWAQDDRALDFLKDQEGDAFNEIFGITNVPPKPPVGPLDEPDLLFP